MDVEIQCEPHSSTSEQSRIPGLYEHISEALNFMKDECFFELLNDYQRLK
jgi:hypothetical protein